jgi:hypothetical protein
MLAVFTGERPESGLQAPVQLMGLKITREALRRNVDEKSFAFLGLDSSNGSNVVADRSG